MNRYYVAIGRPGWSLYKEHVLDTEDEVIAFKKQNAWSESPIRVIYGMEMDFEPAVVVETYRLVPRTETALEQPKAAETEVNEELPYGGI